MRTLVPLAAVLAVACTGTTAPVGNATPTAVVSPWPSGSPTADATTSPSASPDVTPAVKVNVAPEGANLSCRLPVTWQVQLDDGTLIPKAGFVTFPTGKLAEDASAPSTAWFYDRAFSKWLPVGRTSVSPDGRRYAYTEGNALSGDTKGKVHVVDVATGADKVVYSGSPIYGIVDFTPAGIYLTSAPGEGRGRGLWLQNPAGGAPRLITQAIIGPSLGGGAAWGFDFNTADPHPATGGLEGPVNEVLRFDLATGASTVWFYRPGADLSVLGFDLNGHPMVVASLGSGNELWLLTSPTARTRLALPTGSASPTNQGAVDRHGVWFTGGYSPTEVLWLYVGRAFQLIASANAFAFDVAGGCIP